VQSAFCPIHLGSISLSANSPLLLGIILVVKKIDSEPRNKPDLINPVKKDSLTTRTNDFFWRLVIKIFGATLSLLFGVIAGGSILGFLNSYRPISGIIFSLAISASAFYWFSTQAEMRILEHIQNKAGFSFTPGIEMLFMFCGLLLFCFLVLLPVIRWPFSYSGNWFAWDAGAYHFPKAIELFRSGSVWDLSIPYGEYPFGYESLLTFASSLSGNENLFGLMHVIILLLLVSSAWLIARIATNLSSGILFFSIILILLSDNIFRVFNIWRIFIQDIYTVGKNDLFLSAAQLAMIVFALIPYRNNKDKWILIGISFASMIALSIKPNSIFLVAPILLLKIWEFVKSERILRRSPHYFSEYFRRGLIIFFMLFLILPGILWALRNQISMGRLFSGGVLQLSSWSILANITNPYFYNYIPKNLILLVGLLIIGFILCLFRRKELRLATFIYFLLLLAFISTPVSGFFQRTDVPTQVSWRFAETLLMFVFIYILLLMNQPIGSLIKIIRSKPWMQIGFSLLVIVFSGWLLMNQSDKMQWKSGNGIILYDQYIQPVGNNGYRSAYDYVQRNVRNSVIWVENGLPFYVYGPGFTNTISRITNPDYLVIIHTDWYGGGRVFVPSFISESDLPKYYRLLYQDDQGSVYRSNQLKD
jgi:hypothetical protein